MAAGYSGTPQSTKLGIKPGLRVYLDKAPDDWALADPPDGMLLVGLSEPVDIIISFFRTAAELPTRLPTLARLVFPAGALWVAWPRRAGGHRSDITDNVVREHALPLGLVDVKIAAIDDDWSAQRLVWRREARSGP
jgi:hypothetical protein